MARPLGENVDYEINIVEKDPLCLVVSLDARRTHTPLAERLLNIVRDGLYLAWICPGSNHKVIGKGAGVLVHFQNSQIFALLALNCAHCLRNLPPGFLGHSFLSLLNTRSAKR